MANQMIGCVLYASQDVRIEARPIPQPADGQVLIRMQRMGICGTDVGYFGRGPAGRNGLAQPFILGHEGAGEVAKLGPGVENIRVGQRVAIDPSQPCYMCRHCMSGRYNLCPDMGYLGSAYSATRDGLFCEYLAFPVQNCFPIPDEMSDGEAAMMEPLAVAMHAVKRAGPLHGASVLVTGGGPIGQLTKLAARALGAGKVALSEVVASRRDFAIRNGADQVFDPTESTFIEDGIAFSGGGFGVILEASGSSIALDQAFDLAGRGGTIVQIGGIKADANVSLSRLMPKELQYLGSYRFANVFATAIEMAAAKRIDVRPLISETLPLTEFHAAMKLAQGRDGVVKVQLQSG
ncbi:MAG: alcohol dehydrogenase catalytic domain-containing protein [Chloroflexota bacterium]